MPAASGSGVKYAYQDHDTDVVSLAPPTLNNWETVFDEEDVRLLWCVIHQSNDETNAKNVEVRWTIDGNEYLVAVALSDLTLNWIYRSYAPSAGGTAGLANSATEKNACGYTDKRGQSFKVEVRITSALGTNQTLSCYCVRETLEAS